MRNLLCLIMICITSNVYCQSSRELVAEAITNMESKNYTKAMELLQKAETTAPTDVAPVYEMGMLYYIQQKYKEALPFFQKSVKGNYVNKSDMEFAMLGNCYDLIADSINAVKTYEEGRKQFPKSGRLWTEEGNLYFGHKNYSKALCYYETSIKTEPEYVSAYRNAATIWSMTDERFQMLMFAELFMNLETSGPRNDGMSALMYEIFNDGIVIDDTSAGVTLTKNMVATMEKKEVVLPMAATYEMGFMVGFTPILIKRTEAKDRSKLKLHEIYTLYKNANEQWFEKKSNKRYRNVVLERQKMLMDQKMLEPYIYWLFRKGNIDEYKEWLGKNKVLFDEFNSWRKNNPIKLTNDNVYQSGFACKN